MDIKIRYLSKTGNTKKIAIAIAEELNVEAKTIKEPVNDADILFLGGAVYAGKISGSLKTFIESLDNSKIKKVAIFGTSGGESTPYAEIKKYLDEKNIQVLDNNFHSLGRFIFYLWKKPDKEDLDKAKTFAKEVIKSLK